VIRPTGAMMAVYQPSPVNTNPPAVTPSQPTIAPMPVEKSVQPQLTPIVSETPVPAELPRAEVLRPDDKNRLANRGKRIFGKKSPERSAAPSHKLELRDPCDCREPTSVADEASGGRAGIYSRRSYAAP
jgi:hypothetical protein